MRRAVLVALVVVAVCAGPAAAKVHPDFTFQSHGTATQPGAVAGLGHAGTYEDFPFTIEPSDTTGAVAVRIQWDNPVDDWDLYVYFKPPGADPEQVASSAQGQTTDEQAVIQAESGPIEAGQYFARVQNYASTNPNFTGAVKFSEYTPPNKPPVAKLKAPKRAVAGKKVLLDASKSKDPDGRIAHYFFDLDGDGTVETDNGTKPRLRHAFKRGFRYVTVKVVDDKGERSYATAKIAVRKK